jgi:hypothetical protein
MGRKLTGHEQTKALLLGVLSGGIGGFVFSVVGAGCVVPPSLSCPD